MGKRADLRSEDRLCSLIRCIVVEMHHRLLQASYLHIVSSGAAKRLIFLSVSSTSEESRPPILTAA
jgi:hypothetical protein